MTRFRVLLVVSLFGLTSVNHPLTAQDSTTETGGMEKVIFYENLTGIWELSEYKENNKPDSLYKSLISNAFCNGHSIRFEMKIPPIVGTTDPLISFTCHIQEVDFETGVFKLASTSGNALSVWWARNQGDELILLSNNDRTMFAPKTFESKQGVSVMTWKRKHPGK